MLFFCSLSSVLSSVLSIVYSELLLICVKANSVPYSKVNCPLSKVFYSHKTNKDWIKQP